MTWRQRSLGLWYSYLKDLGEDTDLIFGEADLVSKKLQLHRFHHAAFDGLGAFLKLLESRGLQTDRPAPSVDLAQRLSARSLIKGLGRLSNFPPPIELGWAQFNPNWQGPAPQSPKFAYRVIARDQTLQLQNLAGHSQVKVGSLLLTALNRALVEQALSPANAHAPWWMISVNLGPNKNEHFANHSSFVAMPLPARTLAAQFQTEFQRELASGFHLLSRTVAELLPVVAPRAARAKVARDHARLGNAWLGLFSNLGDFSKRVPIDENRAYFLLPTVSKVRPIAASALTWSERLTLSIRVHPALGDDSAICDQWIDAWMRELFEPRAAVV